MPTPGIGDPYWYEWFVGLRYVIKMVNPDSGITCVIFQHSKYNTIDDVVVEYESGKKQLCYQVKHEISTSVPTGLTFGKMLEVKGNNKECLFKALFLGWEKARSTGSQTITPILYTNRAIHDNRARRNYNGKDYNAYPVDKFVSLIQNEISNGCDLGTIEERDYDLACQWNELCDALGNIDIDNFISFFKTLSIEGNQPNLSELERTLIDELSQTFACSSGIAWELFGKLLVGLRKWSTSTRNDERVFREDAYSALGVEEDGDDSQHRLAAPYPFFKSRQIFCEEFDKVLQTTRKKVVFLSGDPGSGKTSTISYLQGMGERFLLRYHTFKPISPEQRFYNADPGMCTPQKLWGTLLIQIRKRLYGRLAQLNVPICNSLVSVQDMRSHVLRLLGILAKEAIQNAGRVFVCIDGIDHAARANASLSFLSTLPLPTEVPDGVCFVIVGQPVAIYREQYPMWLSTSEYVERVTMPKLCMDDVEQLILANASQFSSDADGLAKLIFEKTEGNNLSAVFAVEEIRELTILDDAVERICSSGITADIQQYYERIWDHMKNALSKIIEVVVFPESIVACPLLLMNGRVNVEILSRALTEYGLDMSDWSTVLNQLYPLVIPTGVPGEYALFHNDFRVFLMGVISEYRPRYEDIALKLAQDLFQNEKNILTYITAIPLLECANRANLIPRYFTPGFVINALAEGVSKQRLDEFAHLSYRAACDNQDMEGLSNTYLAIKTLYQHHCYFEYFGREYECNDYPEISSVDISEVRTLPIEQQNLGEFEKVLSLCCKMNSARTSNCHSRAVILYQKWFGQLTPITFLPLCTGAVSEENDWELKTTEVGLFLQQWGSVTAELDLPVPEIKKPTSPLETRSVITYGEQYFKYCISHKKYDLAIEAITAGYVTVGAFTEELETLYYEGVSKQFEYFLTRVPAEKEKPMCMLLAQAIKVSCDSGFVPDRGFMEDLCPIKHVYDEACFGAVLGAFLLGRINRDTDDTDLVDLAVEMCSELEEGDEKAQLDFFVQTASLLGKYYWDNVPISEKLTGYVTWLLTAKVTRPFDYSKARKFLLYTLLHSQAGMSFGAEEWFVDALSTSLFQIDNFGMYYKTAILDYLKQYDRTDIIKKYIEELYGENCCSISLAEDKVSMHEKFSPYGEIVCPEMIQKFSNQLKWDVVGYMGYKEYAMYAPLDCFRIICEDAPDKWKDLGIRLFCQSEIADYSGNNASYEIRNELTKAAASCELGDYWELRTWSDDFRLSPNQIHHSLFEFIQKATSADDLRLTWMLGCGIHSWYTQDGRSKMKCIFSACNTQAEKISVDFVSIAKELTPQWLSIVDQEVEQYDVSSDEESYTIQKAKEIEENRAQYSGMSISEILTLLPTISTLPHPMVTYSTIIEKALSKGDKLAEYLSPVLLSVCGYLRGKEWTFEKFDSVIKSLLSALGNNAFWEIAKCIEPQLSDYDYQISSRNLQLLFKLMSSGDTKRMESLFDAELQTQMLWINGNEHIDIAFDLQKTVSKFPLPQSLPEMALYILVEQIETKNARKIESALFAIYLLGVHFVEVINAIPTIWPNLSGVQTEYLLLVIAKWCADDKCPKELCNMLIRVYNSCDELSHKYLLHSILLKLNMQGFKADALTYCADAEKYVVPDEGVPVRAQYCELFLSLLERCDAGRQSADKIRKYISVNDELEELPKDRYAEEGDLGVTVIRRDLNSILYAEEKDGRWDSIPLLSRKSRLIPVEDPFLLTEMPCMVFDETWFPHVSGECGMGKDGELSDKQMADIAQGKLAEGEKVLAACLWYPFGHKGGKKYYLYSKVGSFLNPYQADHINWSVGNYGLLAEEGPLDEETDEDIYYGGISLFNNLGGNHWLWHGNCQLVPSAIWRKCLGCKPSDISPYIWIDDQNRTVFYFERVASPYKGAIREAYMRQPILFRWICNYKWLENVLSEKRWKIWWNEYSEDYPYH